MLRSGLLLGCCKCPLATQGDGRLTTQSRRRDLRTDLTIEASARHNLMAPGGDRFALDWQHTLRGFGVRR